MRFLLDTNVFLWLQTRPARVGAVADRLAEPSALRFVSVVSGWEIAIKYATGKLPIPEPPASYVPGAVAALAADLVPIELSHALAVADLPAIHRDPFDRLLIAQARALDATLITADATVDRYPVDSILVGEL